MKLHGMLCHSNFSLRENFKLQPFITVFAVFCVHLPWKSLTVAGTRPKAEGQQKGQAFPRRVNTKHSNIFSLKCIDCKLLYLNKRSVFIEQSLNSLAFGGKVIVKYFRTPYETGKNATCSRQSTFINERTVSRHKCDMKMNKLFYDWIIQNTIQYKIQMLIFNLIFLKSLNMLFLQTLISI